MNEEYLPYELGRLVCRSCGKNLGVYPKEFAEDELQKHYEVEHDE